MRSLLFALTALLSMSAHAEKLSIDRLFDDPGLSGPEARGVKIAPDGSRVTYLRGREEDKDQLDLWEYRLADGRAARLVDSRALAPEEQLSEEEKARRERARTADLHGILDYDWAPDSRSVLFKLGGALYLYRLDARHKPPSKLADGAVIDPKVSPRGHFVSFVRDQDLHVIDLSTGVERALTRDGAGTVHNAEAEFVAQEEMDQSSGYWWSPDERYIAFKRFDEAPVPVERRFEVYPDRTEIVEQRYPAAGDPNVKLSLGLVAAADGAIRWIELGPVQDFYLPRVRWSPDGRTLSYQWQARDQKSLRLIGVNPETLAQRTLLTETSSTWINLNDDLYFLESSPAFIWASERSGFKHLYLYSEGGELLRPLTQGDWQVDSLLAVDEAQGRVYFDANKDAVIDRQLYAVRLDGRDAATPRRITEADGWHDIRFGRSAALYVDSFSDPGTPPQTSVHAADGRHLAWIEHNLLDASHPYAPYRDAHVVPEFGHIAAEDGQALWYSLYKPAGFDPARRYPVMMYFYGGPTSQLAKRSWVAPFSEFMAQHGYVVFTLDNRGMERRGRAFSDPIYGRLGDIEVRDQIAGIHWLRKQGFVDPARIGVFGWSYGGYMTLMILARHSDLLAGGAAVAPVTDWSRYDTHYTERYLSTPRANPEGYARSGVFAWLDGLKSPLLLAHGMADDNVLFVHSTALMAELQERGRTFELMTYPGGKHSLSTPAMKKHVHHTIFDFFERHVKGAD